MTKVGINNNSGLSTHFQMKDDYCEHDRHSICMHMTPESHDNFFIAMFLYCMTGITDDDLAAIRQLTTEKYLGIQGS